jgi:alkaline phosphatase
LLQARIDVLLGAGADWFLPASQPPGRRADGRDLLAEARADGYVVARDAAGLEAVSGGRVLRLFDFDLAAVDERRPTLAEMTRKTLDLVGARPRFFAMIEQEGVDTRSHSNSFATMASALRSLDEAVALAAEWAAGDGAVLLIVTADHGPAASLSTTAARAACVWPGLRRTTAACRCRSSPTGPQAWRFTGLRDNTEIPAPDRRDARHTRPGRA